jgi:hypothetical protein
MYIGEAYRISSAYDGSLVGYAEDMQELSKKLKEVGV